MVEAPVETPSEPPDEPLAGTPAGPPADSPADPPADPTAEPPATTHDAAIRWVLAAAASRRTVLAAHALVLLLFAAGLPRLALDDSPQAFLVEDALELERYQSFQRLFGRDEVLRVTLEGEALWTESGLEWLARLERELGAIRGVLGAAGPWTHHRWLSAAWPPESPEHLRRRVRGDPLDLAAGWVSPDGELLSVLVVLHDQPAEDQRRVVTSVRQILTRAPAGIEAGVHGLPVVAAALDDSVLDLLGRTFPLLVVLALSLLALGLRSMGAVAVPLAFVAFVLTVVLGAMGWAEVRLDVVLAVVVPLVFVIASSTAIYVLVEYRLQRRLAEASGADGHRAALRGCYRERGWPVLWAGITTAAGFGSLTLGSLPAVRSLGLWTALGIAISTLEAFFLLPALLEALAGRAPDDAASSRLETWARRLGRRSAEGALAHRRVVALAFALVALAAALALPRLETGTGVLELFRPAHPLRIELERLEARGVGVVAAEVVLGSAAPSSADTARPERGATAGFEDPAALRALDHLGSRLRALPGVLSVLTPFDLVAAARRSEWERAGAPLGAPGAPLSAPSAPVTDPEIAAALRALRARPELAALLASSLRRDGEAARVTIMVPMAPLRALEPLFEQAPAVARELFPDARVWLTGVYPLVLRGQRAIARTMASSLLLTLAVVATILALLTRSVRGLLACLIPNLLPVVFILGAMAAAAIPLDGATLMIAAVVLGIAVDDTLHTLGAFRRRAPVLGARRAAVAALEHTAAGHLLTTATLAAGFLACGLSGFVPVARFGLLTALALLFALCADLLLVPILLAALDQRELSALTRRNQSRS